MLISTEVEVRVIPKTLKYYNELGYNTKVFEKMIIKIEDLSKGSILKIEVRCDYCNNLYYPQYRTYLIQSENSIIHKDCCVKCKILKMEESNLLLYNNKNYMKTEEGINKQQKALKERYGVNYLSQIEGWKDKVVNTSNKKYGKDHYSKTDEFKKRTKETSIKKFGYENASQNNDIKEKVKNTCLEKYGEESYSKTDEFKNRVEETNIKRYGVKCQFLIPANQEKLIKRNIELYGEKYPLLNEEEKIKRKIKANITLSANNTISTSKEQLYLCELLDGKLNYPIDRIFADILINDNIVIEYNGSGHDLPVKCNRMSKEEFERKELKRDLFLKSKKYKLIKIISLHTNKVPQDNILILLIDMALEKFKEGRSWFNINIDNSTIEYRDNIINFDFGTMRNISKNKKIL